MKVLQTLLRTHHGIELAYMENCEALLSRVQEQDKAKHSQRVSISRAVEIINNGMRLLLANQQQEVKLSVTMHSQGDFEEVCKDLAGDRCRLHIVGTAVDDRKHELQAVVARRSSTKVDKRSGKQEACLQCDSSWRSVPLLNVFRKDFVAAWKVSVQVHGICDSLRCSAPEPSGMAKLAAAALPQGRPRLQPLLRPGSSGLAEERALRPSSSAPMLKTRSEPPSTPSSWDGDRQVRRTRSRESSQTSLRPQKAWPPTLSNWMERQLQPRGNTLEEQLWWAHKPRAGGTHFLGQAGLLGKHRPVSPGQPLPALGRPILA